MTRLKIAAERVGGAPGATADETPGATDVYTQRGIQGCACERLTML